MNENIFSNIYTPSNNGLDDELQAQQTPEYEQEYLEGCLHTQLRNQYRSPSYRSSRRDQVTKSTQLQTDSNKKEPLLQEELSSKASKTGVSLMAFFNVKRFIQRIRYSKLRLSQLKEDHLKLINDNASDIQAFIAILKFKCSTSFQLQNVSRLFRQQTLVIPNQSSMAILKEKYLHFKKEFYDKLIKLIPQFHPEQPYKIIWDYGVSITRLILLILIPLEIAYQPGILFQSQVWITILIICILFMDILVRFNTVCYNRGQAVLDRNEIIKLQLKKSLFLDVVLIILLIYFSQSVTHQLSQFALLYSFLQFTYIEDVIQKSEESQYFSKKQKGIISLLKLIITLVYILHLFSCLWYLTSSFNINDSWISFKELTDQDWTIKYLESFYFAIVTMLTIGYGDNVPKTWNEKLITILFIFIVCLWFSYSVNTIGTIIKELNQNLVERRKKIRVINRYMHQRNIPFSLQYKIREYLNFRWKEEAEIDLQQEEQLLNELSDELKEDLRKQANSVFFKHCTFLTENFTLECQNALSFHINRQIILPQNTFSIHTLAQTRQPHLCFVEQGRLQFQNTVSGSLKGISNSGQFLEVQDFITENSQSQTFKAIGYVSLLVLSKNDFLNTLQQFPKDYQKYCALKDSIVLNIKPCPKPYGVYCPACQENTHSFLQCNNLRLPVDRELVIKRHLYSLPQQRQAFKRSVHRSKDVFKALVEQEVIEQFAYFYQNERPLDIINQLNHQIVYEQDPDQSQNNPSSPNQKIFQRHDSIILSNHQSSNSLNQSGILQPKQKYQIQFLNYPNNMYQSQVSLSCDSQKQQKSSSHNNQYNNNNVEQQNNQEQTNQNKHLQIMNKYMTSKYSIYKKNYLNRAQAQNTSEINMNQSRTSKCSYNNCDLHETMSQNIEQLYMKIQRDGEYQLQTQEAKEIELLYLRLRPQMLLDNFEIVKNFDYYLNLNNIDHVIVEYRMFSRVKFKKTLKQLLAYMYYPFEYVSKFQKLSSSRAISQFNKKRILRKATQRLSKIYELKSVLSKKKTISRKHSRIFPSDQ